MGTGKKRFNRKKKTNIILYRNQNYVFRWLGNSLEMGMCY